jgi:hypothetical protein
VTAAGFTVPSLSLGSSVTFTNVPVYVLDGSGFDGILGMNLFDHAASMLYNPYGQGGASLSVNFLGNNVINLVPPGGTTGSGTTGSGTTGSGTTGSGTTGSSTTGSSTAGSGTSSSTPSTPLSGTMALPHSFAFSVSAVISLSAPENLPASPYLLIALQVQQVLPALAALPALFAGNPVAAAGSSDTSLLPGYGTISISEAAFEAGSGSPTAPGQPPGDVPPAPVVPDEAPPPVQSSPEAHADAVTALFASLPEAAALPDDASEVAWRDNVAAETLTKLAIVIAGFWGSIYDKKSARARQALIPSTRPTG